MSDDVKVKFGGDFTDVAKGAESAVGKAGATLNSWFNDFGKSMQASILSSLALANIFSNFVKGAAEALQYFREMDLALKRFGGNGDAQFQQLARYGKEVGVSMETVARTTNYFNKVRSEAAKGNQTYVSILKQFGFTQKEINSGNISAIEVLGRLADAYDKTGYEGLVGERAMNLFGIRGKELTGIFKNGREALEAFTKSMATMSRESITKLSDTQAKIEQFQRVLKQTFQEKPLESYAEYYSKTSAQTAVGSAYSNAFKYNWNPTPFFESSQTTGGGTIAQQAASDAGMIVSQLEGFVPGIRDAVLVAKENLKYFHKSDRDKEYYGKLISALESQIKQIEGATKEKKPGLEIPLVKELLTSSSLQAIGGGDISSVLSGTIQASMLTAMQETANNTGKLAAEADAKTGSTAPNVAK
jgi:hypothetical protein